MNQSNTGFPLQMKPCPFCGADLDWDGGDTLYPTGTWWRPHSELGKVYIRHQDRLVTDNEVWVINCSCGCEMYGDTRDEVLAKWETRV